MFKEVIKRNLNNQKSSVLTNSGIYMYVYRYKSNYVLLVARYIFISIKHAYT